MLRNKTLLNGYPKDNYRQQRHLSQGWPGNYLADGLVWFWMALGPREGPELTGEEMKPSLQGQQWHCNILPLLSYSPALLPTSGEPLESFNLSDKPAFDLCTEPAMYCQMMMVTCPPDCICAGYQELSCDHCRHKLHSVRPSCGQSFSQVLPASGNVKSTQ